MSEDEKYYQSEAPGGTDGIDHGELPKGESDNTKKKVVDQIKDEIIESIKYHEFDRVDELVEKEQLQDYLLENPEIRQAYADCLIAIMSGNASIGLHEFEKLSEHNYFNDIAKLPEVQKAAVELVKRAITWLPSRIDSVSFGILSKVYQRIGIVIDLCNLSVEEFLPLLKESIIMVLDKYDHSEALKLKECSYLYEIVCKSPEVQLAAKDALIKALSIDKTTFRKLISEFGLEGYVQSPEFFKVIEKFLADQYSSSKFDKYYEEKIIKFIEFFNVSKEIVDRAKLIAIMSKLSEGSIDIALQMKNEFNLSEEMFQSSEVQQAARDGMIKLFMDKEIGDVIKIANNFKLPSELLEDIDVEFYATFNGQNLIKYIPYLAEVKNKFPMLSSKIILEIDEHIDSNIDLADYFVENLDKYYQNLGLQVSSRER